MHRAAHHRSWEIAVVATLLGAGPALGKPDALPSQLDFSTERVIVFKDGHGLFVKSATGVVDDEGRLFTEQVPPTAVLGTFWASAEPHAIRTLKAHEVEQAVETSVVTDCVTNLELLRANQGRALTLTTHRDGTWSGLLADVLELDLDAPPAAGAGGAAAVLESNGRQRIIPIADIRTIEGDGLATTMTRVTRTAEAVKRLTFQFDRAARGRRVTVQMLYFTPGIRWIPTYRVEGELLSNAQIELQAEILNELEDLEGAALSLVVGVPNFRFADTVSPLSLESVMRSALGQVRNGLDLQLSNATFAQRAGEWRGDYAAGPADQADVAAIAPELAAAGEQDFFVYSVEDFDLERGARATIPLWRSTVPLRHLYTADFHVVRDHRSGATYQDADAGGSPLRLASNRVWHQLELTNTTDVPWTTGPALLLRSFLPLGQDLLTYTPLGGCALLPMTVAVDVRATQDEVEIGRQANVLSWGGYAWSIIRKRGTVTITNYQAEAIDARISVTTGGRVTSATREGSIHVDDMHAADWQGGAYSINNRSIVTWPVKLDPKQTVTVEYEVELYVR